MKRTRTGQIDMEKPRNLLIIGFNARPIALSAQRAGFNISVVDYWGDLDLLSAIPNARIISQEKERLITTSTIGESLLEVTFEVIDEAGTSIDGILIGSGLDDRPDIWKKLHERVQVFGNDVEVLARVRDRMILESACDELSVNFPPTLLADSWAEIPDLARKLDFPLVLRLPFGAGGQYIRLAKKQSELKKAIQSMKKENLESPCFLQKYIRGKDVSTTILSNRDQNVVLSCNEQLLGQVGNELAPFQYSGNIIPLEAPAGTLQNLKEVSNSIATHFQVRGLNGIDFVLKKGEPWLMEINPRFPGTLELLEKVSAVNLIELHVDACLNLPLPRVQPPRKIGIKRIVFAPQSLICGELSSMPGVYDVPFPQNVVRRGEPVCTIQLTGKSRESLKEKVDQTVQQVLNSCTYE